MSIQFSMSHAIRGMSIKVELVSPEFPYTRKTFEEVIVMGISEQTKVSSVSSLRLRFVPSLPFFANYIGPCIYFAYQSKTKI